MNDEAKIGVFVFVMSCLAFICGVVHEGANTSRGKHECEQGHTEQATHQYAATVRQGGGL